MSMNDESRKNMYYVWGPEIVAQCCTYWKLHFANGKWGSCGICHKHPKMVDLTWDELDNIETNKKENK